MRRHATTRLPQDASEFDLGFCLGLIAGEGSICRHGRTARALRLRVTFHSNDPEPVRLLERTMGGYINGPYEYERPGRRSPHCLIAWCLCGVELKRWAAVLIDRMPPCRKRQQLLAALGQSPEPPNDPGDRRDPEQECLPL
jgi:hypothetical protein